MALNWLSFVFRTICGGLYSPAPTPIADGSSGPMLIDAYGRAVLVAVPPNSPTTPPAWLDSTAYGGSGVIKPSAGMLFEITGVNDSAAAYWIQLHDKATVPVLKDVPKCIYMLAPGEKFNLPFPGGRPFVNGIAWGLSSKGDSFAAAASPQAWVNAQYA